MVDQVELLERVKIAIEDSVWLQHGSEIDFQRAARAALEASHHAELVEALRLYHRVFLPAKDGGLHGESPGWGKALDEAVNAASVVLAKVRTPTTPERSDDE